MLTICSAFSTGQIKTKFLSHLERKIRRQSKQQSVQWLKALGGKNNATVSEAQKLWSPAKNLSDSFEKTTLLFPNLKASLVCFLSLECFLEEKPTYICLHSFTGIILLIFFKNQALKQCCLIIFSFKLCFWVDLDDNKASNLYPEGRVSHLLATAPPSSLSSNYFLIYLDFETRSKKGKQLQGKVG